MKNEIEFIIAQLKEAYEGQPWFGRSATSILGELNEDITFQKPSNQHSALEILWHMITWREFVIDRLQHSPQMPITYFDRNDWRQLELTDITLWKQGLERLSETQSELLAVLQNHQDSILDVQVPERDYNFRFMLHGFIQHDAYHLGQIVYIKKMMAGR